MSTTLFASVEAKPAVTRHVEAALRGMITRSLAETGCVRYELFRSEEKANTFHLLETYANAEALASHHRSAHFTDLVASLADRLVQVIQIERLAALEAE